MEEECNRCGGSGWYQYSTSGTPHSKVCEVCCDHAGEPWPDTANGNPNDYYCRSGCGTLMKSGEAAQT